MLIRTEAPADMLVIGQLLRETFPTEAEANLVQTLRENGRNTLSLVACTDEGQIVGHLLFTPVEIDGHDVTWQGLAPLCVHPDYQQQGIARLLIEEGFVSLPELGYAGCVVLGDPALYGKFGFESASAHGLSCQWDVPEGAFQIKPLIEGAFDNHQGVIRYCPEFSEL
ncbi:GNAT family N-acetyltransferase [Vibrio astriarenae]|jgi:putative acetyltransferase|uniref:GNAT family N-acetyltransferase n=1 Tax=Vibrio agarivorans TaxID=153622 RepID=UPI0025B3DD17|nr:N-acetyltransferase [Vibrio agarivorans]MDN3662575.1 N-acetyltransferase [Vibrio agarivorans]